MKKIILLIVMLTPSLFSGCIVGAGMGDYKIEMPEDYAILRTSSESITIGKSEGDGAWSTIVPSKVTEVYLGENYIVAKQVTVNSYTYWIINLKDDTIYDRLTDNEFLEKLQELNIKVNLKPIDNFKKEYGVK
ncbi:Uncharacterised protein [uncultured Clostridium sp.]|uniref:DUF3997 domain-containing protein n=1 Tax=uncultured Clostridium sp. TaxID=59620 RepID=UPI0008204323|nr:DUF3997 domain-containing protein [uncultured Clostridium sp.]SCJ60428.1 Uncharacterised protein [uncultured Clostridium sp.]